MTECIACGYPRWRPGDHASWCEDVQAEHRRWQYLVDHSMSKGQTPWLTEAEFEDILNERGACRHGRPFELDAECDECLADNLASRSYWHASRGAA